MQLRRRNSRSEVLRDRVQDFAGRAAELGDQTVTALAPRVEEARDIALGAYDHARERVRDDYVPLVRDEYVPRVRGEVSDRYRKDVLPRAKAVAASPKVAAALARSPIDLPAPRKKTHKVRNTVLLLGVGGAAAYGVSRLVSGSTSGGSSYEPPPRPTAVPDPAPAAPPSDEAGVDAAPAGEAGDEPTADQVVADSAAQDGESGSDTRA